LQRSPPSRNEKGSDSGGLVATAACYRPPMVYVALLRGINVGGSNKVDMKQLKMVFEGAGMADVKTYINSGNVIFSSRVRGRARIEQILEEAIAEHVGFEVRVLLRDINSMRSLVKAIPSYWTNDQAMRCDVIFLWREVDRPSIVGLVPFKPVMEDVRYVPGALIWRIDRENATRSGMSKVVGTPLYKQMTIRNCNTARKLLELMER
jgi:uncharacterized protein (DUF1697 family)